MFNTPLSSPVYIGLLVVYFICESISTFDTRIIQAKKNGFLREDEAFVPQWTGIFAILGWLSFLGLILLNWKIAIAVFIIKFILKVAPVLENIGALLLLPVVGKETASAVNVMSREQNKAAKSLKAMSKAAKDKRAP